MTRRWTPGTATTVSGTRFRVVPGMKGDGDLRLEWWTPEGWLPIEMAAAFLMTDFFVENEEHLRQFRPHWRETGADYFFGFLRLSVANGWETARDKLAQQREVRRVTTSAQPLCYEEHPSDPSVHCLKPRNHEYAHADDEYVWPRTAA